MTASKSLRCSRGPLYFPLLLMLETAVTEIRHMLYFDRCRPPYALDANILIYAFRQDAPQHRACYDWLTAALSKGEDVTASSVVELALLRITTLPSLKESAATPEEVFRFLSALRQTSYRRLEPGEAHGAHLQKLCDRLNLKGNDVNDAFLAALALENSAILVSTDRGFKRFPMIRLRDPLDPNI